VYGDRHEACEACKCTKAHALSVAIQALEFKPVGPQNQWVDVMFLTSPGDLNSECPHSVPYSMRVWT
jgi:hypothetical protein